MLFQSLVPNTYAAGQASLATWNKRTTQPVISAEPETGTWARCECGRPRIKTKAACATCLELDSEQNTDDVDATVISAFQIGEEVSSMTLVERCGFKHDRHVIRRTLKRLMDSGRVSRRALGARRDGFLYTRLV